jgi:hypothetical protein
MHISCGHELNQDLQAEICKLADSEEVQLYLNSTVASHFAASPHEDWLLPKGSKRV